MTHVAHLFNGLAAVRVDPEGSCLDHLLWVYLGDVPFHLIYQSPAGCKQHMERTPLALIRVRIVVSWAERQAYRHIPPHLMSCPCLAA